MQLFDSHCHLDVDAFDHDREQIIARCQRLGVNRILIPAVIRITWKNLLALCAKHTGLYPALGLHPVYLDAHNAEDVAALDEYLQEYTPIAVGEIGLDFFIADLDRQKQQVLFEAQLQLAQQYDLPVILHIRKAHDQVLATLKRIPVCGGICHAFNGSMQQAEKFIERGFKLGFGGTLTYARSRKIRAVAAQLPVDSIVLETDAPDIVVASHHGERNSPEYLPEVLNALAELRNMPADNLARQTTANTLQALRLEN